MPESTNSADQQWYEQGLCFSCTQCGNCCTVEGYVWVDLPAMQAMAEYLGLAMNEFTKKYVRRVGRRYSLIEQPSKECVFWRAGCQVYPARPLQCRTFPFWPDQMENLESWQEGAKTCPGMNQGRHYSGVEIKKLMSGEDEASHKRERRCDTDLRVDEQS